MAVIFGAGSLNKGYKTNYSKFLEISKGFNF